MDLPVQAAGAWSHWSEDWRDLPVAADEEKRMATGSPKRIAIVVAAAGAPIAETGGSGRPEN